MSGNSMAIAGDLNKAYNHLADIASSSTAHEFEESCKHLLQGELARQPLVIYHHPFYTSEQRALRLRSLTQESQAIAACGGTDACKTYNEQEKALGELFFRRIWAFQRSHLCSKFDHTVVDILATLGQFPTGLPQLVLEYVNAGKEVYLQYQRPRRENAWLDQTFGLDHICKEGGDKEYTFWTPDLDEEQLLRRHCDGTKNFDLPETSSYFNYSSSGDNWYHLEMDGHSRTEQIYGTPSRRQLLCLDYVDRNIHLKRFTPATMEDMSLILARLAQRQFQVYSHQRPHINGMRLSLCALFQVESSPRRFLVCEDVSLGIASESFSVLSRILLTDGESGAWLQRSFTPLDRPAFNSYKSQPERRYCIDAESATGKYRLSDDSILDCTTTQPVLRCQQGTFSLTRLSFASADLASMGMEWEREWHHGRQAFVRRDCLALRSISPIMVLPEEAARARVAMQKILERMGRFPPGLISLVERYWNLEALTLPKKW